MASSWTPPIEVEMGGLRQVTVLDTRWCYTGVAALVALVGDSDRATPHEYRRAFNSNGTSVDSLGNTAVLLDSVETEISVMDLAEIGSSVCANKYRFVCFIFNIPLIRMMTLWHLKCNWLCWLVVCLLAFCILTTSKVIPEWAPTCDCTRSW